MVKVHAILRTEMGAYIEFVSPKMLYTAAADFAERLREAGETATIVPFDAKRSGVREVVP